MAWAPCRKRNGDALLRAENCGDLKTADHKVLIEGGESRNNHRYAVVVQDFGHSVDSILSVQKQKLLRRRRGVYESFFEPSEKPLVTFSDNSLEFGTSCEESSRDQRTIDP